MLNFRCRGKDGRLTHFVPSTSHGQATETSPGCRCRTGRLDGCHGLNRFGVPVQPIDRYTAPQNTSNNVGNTTLADGKPTHFNGDVEKALASIQVPFLYMPSATDLYFPLEDAQYEAPFIPHGTLMPIPSLWGHAAGAGASPADKQFLNEKIAAFLAQK